MIMSHHNPGEVIFSQGDDANALYIVKKGEVDVIKDGDIIACVPEGSQFGENALLESSQAKRSASIVAKSDVMCLSLPRQLLLDIFGQDVQAIALTNYTRACFGKSENLAHYTRTQQERMMNEMKIINLEPGVELFKKDQEYNEVVLILEGKLNQVNEEDGTETLEPSIEFGAKEAADHKSLKLDHTYKAGSKLSVAKIDFATIYNMFGENLYELFEQNKFSHEVLINRKNEKPVRTLPLEDLQFYKYLGAGSYGAVNLVTPRVDSHHYLALKSISKKLVNNQTALQLLKNEKEILSFVEFPLIISMEGICKEEEYIHFAIEFVDGLPYDEVLMKLDQLSEWQTCFYISQIVLMLQYLHRHGIIYRDLKAQNIICGTDGYLKLVDMGTAKFLKQSVDGSYERTFTVVGTPHYTAPEIIQQKGYTFTADYWSLGILLYEVAVGGVPFGAEESDVFQVYQEILKAELVFPDFLDWENCKDVMKQLLNKSPDARLGAGVSAFKAHKWFELINWDWDKLLNKKITPDFSPDSMVDQQPSEETKEADYLHKRIVEASRTMNAVKTFKSNLPVDWDKDF